MTPRSSSLTWARASGGYMSDWTVKKGVVIGLRRGGIGDDLLHDETPFLENRSYHLNLSHGLGGSRTWGEKTEEKLVKTRPGRSLPTYGHHRGATKIYLSGSHTRSPERLENVIRETFPRQQRNFSSARRIIPKLAKPEAFGFKFRNILRLMALSRINPLLQGPRRTCRSGFIRDRASAGEENQ